MNADWRALERDCKFTDASRAALAAGDRRDAVRLAALAGDRGTLNEAIDALADAGTPEEIENAAEDLYARGFALPAGELFECCKRFERAGEAFRVGHDPIRAAQAYERAGKPAEGAKALERALKDDPSNEKGRLELARLLARHGRTEAAVKAIQAMRHGTQERRAALPLLARSLRALGLVEAALEIEKELDVLGIPVGDDTGAGLVAEVAAAGQVVFGRYEIVAEVAKTPNARVARGKDRVNGAEVALKFVNAAAIGTGRDALVRFEREARALAQLRHPNIVALLAYFEDGPAMVLEWMAGGSLFDLLAKTTLAPARAVEIAVAVLGALGEAHRLGILHRDVKPANVLFDGIGTPRLADFGAAHLSDSAATATAAAIGTLVYMSPEQRLGRPAGVASDIYAVGALLYEMLTGDVPFPLAGGRFRSAVDGEPSNRSEPPSAYHVDLGPEHDRVVGALLAEDPAQRPRDTFEARKAIESLRWSDRVLARAAPASVRPRGSVPPPAAGRLHPARETFDGRDAARLRFDAWFDRHVVVIPFEPPALELARAFAGVGHAPLPVVLRASEAEREIWVSRPLGASVADGARLTPRLVRGLVAAIRALHERGVGHGALDAAHVYVQDDAVNLAYPRTDDRTDAIARDDAALAELARRVGLAIEGSPS
ncbi:MAG: protein kinase [Polyangiaceae bacterium]